MPEICRFRGIRITMYSGEREHPPPHFHAQHGTHEAVFDIRTGAMTAGSLSAAVVRVVQKWCAVHQAELEENWRLATDKRMLNPIKPL